MEEDQDPADMSSPTEGPPDNHVADCRDFAAWRNSSNTAVESPAGGGGGAGEDWKCRPPATGYLMGTSAQPVTAQKAKGKKMLLWLKMQLYRVCFSRH